MPFNNCVLLVLKLVVHCELLRGSDNLQCFYKWQEVYYYLYIMAVSLNLSLVALSAPGSTRGPFSLLSCLHTDAVYGILVDKLEEKCAGEILALIITTSVKVVFLATSEGLGAMGPLVVQIT